MTKKFRILLKSLSLPPSVCVLGVGGGGGGRVGGFMCVREDRQTDREREREREGVGSQRGYR